MSILSLRIQDVIRRKQYQVRVLRRLYPRSTLLAIVTTLIIVATIFQRTDPSVSSVRKLRALENEKESRLASYQSYGFFDDISDKEWVEFYQKPAKEAEHYVDKDDPNKGTDIPSKWKFYNWAPYFNCPHIFKLGGPVDGGKWTCDPERIRRSVQRRNDKGCLIYSIGSNGNYVFENAVYDLLGPLCEIHVFDYSANYWESWQEAKNIHFHRWGLSSTYSPPALAENIQEKDFFPFLEIKRKLGHEGRTIDIFKIDCEGCEWHTYKDWIKEDVRQILIETHYLPRIDTVNSMPQMHASEFFDSFKNHGFALFSKEPNTLLGEGVAVEWSFVKLHPDFYK